MKDQRWPGDYETVGQEFRASRHEEQMGMNDAMRSRGNDFIPHGDHRPLDAYEIGELEPSWCTQIETNGMQPHSREYLERDIHGLASARKFTMVAGQRIDHCDGIQFSGMP